MAFYVFLCVGLVWFGWLEKGDPFFFFFFLVRGWGVCLTCLVKKHLIFPPFVLKRHCYCHALIGGFLSETLVNI
ncbi:hypothetical protein QBC36DRAFT_334084 [Triangularia setosa]|uniref:Uncharacterized protein n=1 Tax=Triangularia setosa TaxID=2587417 RepID=A0AAN7A6K2_9PEZI|nr:hypothetical protein QBC36DRAFT_334084 [Podospora setosa]